MIKTKSVYGAAEASDGLRILVSSFWPQQPRDFTTDLWFPELGSPLELIKNWQGRPYDWIFFADTYKNQLIAPGVQRLIQEIASQARDGNVTLIGQAKQSQP